jgi:hypothetical protein
MPTEKASARKAQAQSQGHETQNDQGNQPEGLTPERALLQQVMGQAGRQRL